MKNERKISLVTVFLLSIIGVSIENVYGHGWGLDTTSIDIEGREIAVTFELPLYFDESKDKVIKVTAVDQETKENANNVTFLIGLFHENKMIFRNYFFTPNGDLAIHIKPTQDGETKIIAEQDSLLGAWYATESQSIELVGPVFASGGLFHFEIEIRTIDESTNIIEGLETYVADVSIAETTEHTQKSLDGNDVKFRMKSYFDKVSNFQYKPEENIVTFETPFDWSEKVVSHVPVVHKEVHFPKDFSDFLYPSYTGKINGIELFKSNVIVDDFTEETERIVHFVILQDHIQYLKQQQKSQDVELPDYMQFTLEVSDKIEFPISAMTRGEQFQIDLSWDPIQIEPGKSSKFVFTIRDGATGQTLRNSSYDFVILQNNVEIHRSSGNAQVGGDSQDYTFSEGQTGPTIIRFENIRGSGVYTEFGLVVVPEFGTIATLVLIVAMTCMLVFNKKFGKIYGS